MNEILKTILITCIPLVAQVLVRYVNEKREMQLGTFSSFINMDDECFVHRIKFEKNVWMCLLYGSQLFVILNKEYHVIPINIQPIYKISWLGIIDMYIVFVGMLIGTYLAIHKDIIWIDRFIYSESNNGGMSLILCITQIVICVFVVVLNVFFPDKECVLIYIMLLLISNVSIVYNYFLYHYIECRTLYCVKNIEIITNDTVYRNVHGYKRNKNVMEIICTKESELYRKYLPVNAIKEVKKNIDYNSSILEHIKNNDHQRFRWNKDDFIGTS